MGDYRKMLREVQTLDFAVHEAALFLDSHPCDKEALEYFNYYACLAEKARMDFERNYGPIQFRDQRDADSWLWVKGPWPWEGGE